MKITLVMMLKNEVQGVRKAIESVYSIIDDVVIGIDNSTTDNTLDEVRGALGSKNRSIHHFDFKDDFSAIRNFLIEKANHEWVLILDGHEYLDPQSLIFLKQLKKTNIGNIEIFDVNVMETKKGSTIFQQPRLFKKHIKYELAIHNVIAIMKNRTSLPQVNIIHDQPLERLLARKEQRKKMNIKGLKEKAESGDARSMYYLAGTYYEMGDFRNAKKWLLKYIPKSDFHHERYEARVQLSLIYLRDGTLDAAEKILLDCFKDDVVLNEHLILLGDIAYKREAYHQAVSFYRAASSFKLPDLFLILKEEAYTWLPWYKIAQCACMTNNVALLKESIRKGKQFAPDREDFFKMETILNKKLEGVKKKKGNLYVIASLPIFIEPYLLRFDKDYNIMFEARFNPDTAERADVIFCDWADYNAIAMSHSDVKAKKIIRLHAYEAYNGFLNKIDFNNVDKVIFVADHIKNHVIKNGDLKAEVISNGVDLGKFQIAKEKEFNNKIAWSGYICNKKGAVLLLTVAKSLPDYEFHVCGTFQEADVRILFETKKPDNLFLYPWQEDLNSFFADKTFILNTSPREGCPVSVLEGMACGLTPLVYNWIGSEKYLNLHSIWENIEELEVLLKSPRKFNDNRTIVKERYDFEDKLNSLENVIDNLITELRLKESNHEVTV